MLPFVLVHGAWGSGDDWRAVRAVLQSVGFPTFTPTLTGLGERARLLHRGITLDTHIQDVVQVLTDNDLWHVVLVGHSYGGMVVTGVVDRAPERVDHLVYLDAYVPADGQSMLDFYAGARRDWLTTQVAQAGDGWLIPPPLLNASEPQGMSAQPYATYTQPVALTNAAATRAARTYIYCTEKQDLPFPDPFVPFAERARADARWRYRELPTAHDAPALMPEALAQLLIEAASAGHTPM
jgi:pimeloyl-ACP methyl ester carboxylesterase